MKKLKRIEPGSKVGIVSLGALFGRDSFKKGIQGLKKIGFVPVLAPNIFKKDFIYSGTVKERVKSFLSMAHRQDIDLIWCVRGGYGCFEVAQELAKLRQPSDPKLVVGLSDVSAIQWLLLQKWGWPSLHGPLLARMGEKKKSRLERETLGSTLFDPRFRLKLSGGLRSVGARKQSAGVLTGGNMTLAITSFKTAWEIDTRGKILFLEDVGERAYRIDRMLWQLEMAGKFDHVKGVIFGEFAECKEPNGQELWQAAIKRRFSGAAFPVIMNFPLGHGENRVPIPLGARVRITMTPEVSFEVLDGIFK